jgi:hypothetical protein
MGYIPRNAKWYLADLVVEFRVEGESDNLVHYNLTLVRADSPEEAYSKALVFGSHHESSYKNPEGKQVQAVFRGLRSLLVVCDELEDGAELLYEERRGLTEEQITATLADKAALDVFVPWTPPS